MPTESLQERVKELHDTLAAGEPLTSSQRASLDQVLEEVESLLGEEEEDALDLDSLAERVREAGLHFEESHPNLTAAIGAVADALARMGI